jgi:predicted metal-binding membrane protein
MPRDGKATPLTDRNAWPPVPRPTLREASVIGICVLCGLAWAALVAWNASPHARYLEHGGVTFSDLGGLMAFGVYVGAWVLMLTAMMLPSAYPLLQAFERVVSRRSGRVRLLAALVGGYLAIWTAVGMGAFVADTLLHEIVHRIAEGWWVMAAILALAGGYQFSSLKYRCLDRCRSPRALVMTHWQGRRPSTEAWRLGLAHGGWCIGCCWALMLIMFAVGHGNLGWMLMLGAVMTLEKVAPFGRWIVVPIGLVLLAGAAATVAVNLVR